MQPLKPSSSTFIAAAAGSRKTSSLIEIALASQDQTLITTYTNENVDQIRSYLIEACGAVPDHITILPWYTFLLRQCARPYQSYAVDVGFIRSLNVSREALEKKRKIARTAYKNRFFDEQGNAISEYLGDFVCLLNVLASGLVLKRLERVFKTILIDEVQDLSGYDLDVLKLLFQSKCTVVAVGDPRQATYMSSGAAKNSKFRKGGISAWFEQLSDAGICSIETKNECYRSNQAICDFADALYPTFEKTVSKNATTTGHDGVFEIMEADVAAYVETFKPTVLQFSAKSANPLSLRAVNIGLSKGRSFDRVLILPTKPWKKYLGSKNIADATSLEKLYIAVTRARQSVCFVGVANRQHN